MDAVATSWALGLLADYLDGVAPPVPSRDLSVQSGEVLRRYDYETKTESWLFTNGITVVCDHAEQVRNQGQDVIRAQNPQVINGQQTTRMLSRSAKGKKASVLVREVARASLRLGPI